MLLHIVVMMAYVPHGLIMFCAALIDGLIYKVDILNEFITSDHKPVYITLKRLKGDSQAPAVSQQNCIPTMDWSRADELCINRLQAVLGRPLAMWRFLLIYC